MDSSTEIKLSKSPKCLETQQTPEDRKLETETLLRPPKVLFPVKTNIVKDSEDRIHELMMEIRDHSHQASDSMREIARLAVHLNFVASSSCVSAFLLNSANRLLTGIQWEELNQHLRIQSLAISGKAWKVKKVPGIETHRKLNALLLCTYHESWDGKVPDRILVKYLGDATESREIGDLPPEADMEDVQKASAEIKQFHMSITTARNFGL